MKKKKAQKTVAEISFMILKGPLAARTLLQKLEK
jgi:hypothetical protein